MPTIVATTVHTAFDSASIGSAIRSFDYCVRAEGVSLEHRNVRAGNARYNLSALASPTSYQREVILNEKHIHLESQRLYFHRIS